MAGPNHLPPGFDITTLRPYGYVPSQGVAITMLVLFGITTLLHTGQAVHTKTWFLLPTAAVCGVMELIGWGARLWSSSEPWAGTPFQIQITLTILAPTPLLAATFVIFGEIINRLGTAYSRLTPKQYTIIFCACDVISLVVQGIGGGLAATANEFNGRDPEFGGNIMLGGVAFQIVVMLGFIACAVDYIVRYTQDRPLPSRSVPGQLVKRGQLTLKLKLMLGGLSLSTVVLFIRGIYRTIELVDGWTGRIITTELYFNVLDGAMVIIAIYVLNFFHPGVLVFSTPAFVYKATPSQMELKPYDNV